MILDVYIGRLNDRSFKWNGGNWEGNVPRRRSPFFPDGDSAFWEVRNRINQGKLDGKQTDWGGWVARVKKTEIEAIIRDLHDANPWYQPGSPMPHMELRLKELRTYVAGLNDYDTYALVATEL